MRGCIMKLENVLLVKKGEIAELLLNRPEKLNAFSKNMRLEILAALEEISQDNNIRVCIITGKGRAFCAGGDIAIMKELKETNNAELLNSFLAHGKDVIKKIRSMPIPVLAAINGPAAGAGMNLALSCDIRISSENAVFGQTFIKIGLNTDWGGSFFLPQLVGSAKALELIWTGKMISAKDALSLNLVNKVVPQDKLMEATYELAQELIQKSPFAIKIAKQAVYRSYENQLDEALAFENKVQIDCFLSRECTDGLSEFLNKKKSK